MKSLLLIILSLSYFSVVGQNYIAKDFTEENIFTKNIEGPNIDSKGNFYVVNFQKDGTIGIVHKDGTGEIFVTLPEGSIGNAIMFDKQENLLVADYIQHNILKVDKKTRKVSVFCHADFTQPNDLCINKKGQLFASDPSWKTGTGNIWRIDPNGKATLLMSNMGTTNGIELSPDEKILYVNESIQRKIWAFDVDEKGGIQNQRLLIEFPDFGLDGMKCDVYGNLYVTRYDKGTVVVISPDGKIIQEISLTGKKVTNITFGGKDGKTCYVTLQERKCIEFFQAEFPGKSFIR